MRTILFLLIISIFSLTGCADSSHQYEQENMETTEATITNSTPVSEKEAKNEGHANEYKIISSQATYIGLIDPHTIEVIIDNKPIALQINEEQMKILEPLKTKELITIEYYYNEETSQNILKKVEIDQ
jgi:hypothetical protein